MVILTVTGNTSRTPSRKVSLTVLMSNGLRIMKQMLVRFTELTNNLHWIPQNSIIWMTFHYNKFAAKFMAKCSLQRPLERKFIQIVTLTAI